MSEPSHVPPLRGGIRVKRTGGRLAVEDEERRIRVPIDEPTLAMMRCLSEAPRPVAELTEAAGLPAEEAWQRARLLNRHLLLDTPRARRQLEVLEQAGREPLWPGDELEEAPLGTPGDLVHGCVACGACCHGTDVGPLTDRDVARIEEHDWSPYLPEDTSPEDWLVEVAGPGGNRHVLTGQRHGRCVFLDDDKLCILHKVGGAHQKPTICRQFPYTFTRTPRGVDVSFSMECRSWWTARQRGEPVERDAPGIREMIREGAPVVDLPVPVPLWYGLDVAPDDWLELRREAIRRVDAAEDADGMVRALAGTVREAVRRRAAPLPDEERFARAETWGTAEPGEERESPRQRVRKRLEAVLGDLRDRYAERGDDASSDRMERVRWTLGRLLAGRRVPDLLRFRHEDAVWRDVALASLYGHEPPRRDNALLGVALLNLRILAGQQLAGLTARTALRGHTTERDVVDAMVLTTKTLRGAMVHEACRRLAPDLVELLVYRVEELLGGSGPQVADDPGYRLVVHG